MKRKKEKKKREKSLALGLNDFVNCAAGDFMAI
jgi:hypothetical protein